MNVATKYFEFIIQDCKALWNAPANGLISVSTQDSDPVKLVSKSTLRNSIALRIANFILFSVTATGFIGSIPLIGGSMISATALIGITLISFGISAKCYNLELSFPHRHLNLENPNLAGVFNKIYTVALETKQDFSAIYTLRRTRNEEFYAAMKRVSGRVLLCLLPAYYLSGASILQKSVLKIILLISKTLLLAMISHKLLQKEIPQLRNPQETFTTPVKNPRPEIWKETPATPAKRPLSFNQTTPSSPIFSPRGYPTINRNGSLI